MGIEENKKVIKRYFEVTDAHDYASMGEILHENFYGDNPISGVSGLQQRKQLQEYITSIFPDIRNEIKEMIAERDKVVVYSTISGTHTGGDFMEQPPTGKKFKIDSIAIYTVKNGKLFDGKIVQDMLGEYQQLGFYPPLPEEK